MLYVFGQSLNSCPPNAISTAALNPRNSDNHRFTSFADAPRAGWEARRKRSIPHNFRFVSGRNKYYLKYDYPKVSCYLPWCSARLFNTDPIACVAKGWWRHEVYATTTTTTMKDVYHCCPRWGWFLLKQRRRQRELSSVCKSGLSTKSIGAFSSFRPRVNVFLPTG